ncbi:MAG TPA: VIT domain-containing protein, partial [Pirellulales bacterium]|nr:VIT domain-containing protein [Pirellulales bacterium]
MHDHNIGDANVERLLETAYKPEAVDAAFAMQVEDEMCVAARAVASGVTCAPEAWPGLRYSEAPADPEVTTLASKAPVSATTASGASEYLSPGHPNAVGVHATTLTDNDPKLQIIRRRLGWAMGLAASLAACFLIYYARTHRFEPSGPMSVQPNEVINAIDNLRTAVLGDSKFSMGLTARPRPETPAAKPIEVGATLVTKAGERRRVTLADGSVLYLNQNTAVKHVAERRIELTKGEVYLEVAPRDAQAGTTFQVKTPKRDISALGTRFGVQADGHGAGVIVTQGKVKVSGLSEEIHAGQQLAAGQQTVITAPRATHLLDWTRDLMAAAESPLVPSSKHAGGALLAIDPSGQEVTLTLRKFHVDVHIEDGFARTTIDQTYFNNNHWRMEGTFYFPLPPDASLSRLAMYVEDGADSRLMEGGMAERDHARNVFETIMNQRRDPALLEWVDGSTFKMRVFPLEGRKEKRILLSYTQRLPSLYGAMRYRFPAGHNMELVRDWSFEARVRHGADLRVTADSHPDMKIGPQGGDMVAKATARGVKPNRDVTLEIYDNAAANAKDASNFT